MSPMSLYSNKSKLQLLRTELLAMIIEELLQSEDIAALTSLQRISTTFEYLVQKYWVKCKGGQVQRGPTLPQPTTVLGRHLHRHGTM